MIEEKIILTSSDGTPISGLLNLPQDEGEFPVVIVLHGFGGTKTNKESTIWSEVLYQIGIGTLRIDLRGAGESGGVYKERTLSGFINDVQAALDYLYQHKYVNKKKIGIIGHSMGGATALLLAARDHRLSTLAVTSPSINPVKSIAGFYDDFSDAEKRGFVEKRNDGQDHRLNYTFFRDAATFDFIKECTAIPYPFLIVAGEKDTVVDITELQTFASHVPNTHLVILPNSEHMLNEDWPVAEDTVKRWFEKWSK